MKNFNDKEKAKKAVGKTAASLIHDGMLVGLGTGSTASCFIDSLIERCRSTNLKVHAVASSERSAKQAKEGGIPLYDIERVQTIDVTVDGADEIDHHKRMIKGGGGALLREKIIASLSKEMIVIVDSTKLVDQLGAFPLPLEVVPFAHEAILHKISHLGYHANFRLSPQGEKFVTDNGNYIIDISFKEPIESPERENAILRGIPGVVETGFFFDMAGRVLVGHSDGHVDIIP